MCLGPNIYIYRVRSQTHCVTNIWPINTEFMGIAAVFLLIVKAGISLQNFEHSMVERRGIMYVSENVSCWKG